VLAGERVGLRELESDRWLVSFIDHDLGHYDRRNRVFEPTNGIPPRRSA
jgi:hypothetical protein